MPPVPRPAAAPYDRAACPVERTLRLLAGRWRLMVLFRLGQGEARFNALQRGLAPISPRVLAATLRGLEADGLVWRAVRGAVPPHVAYGLTPRGAALAPVFEAMADWGSAEADGGPESDASGGLFQGPATRHGAAAKPRPDP